MTQARFKIKKGDLVEVITGSHKGKRGNVLKVFLNDARVQVEGVNVVKRNQRISELYPEGYVMKTLPIDISNVAIVDPTTNKPGKVYVKILSDGSKQRYFKKTDSPV